jgi:hypothetical protein
MKKFKLVLTIVLSSLFIVAISLSFYTKTLSSEIQINASDQSVWNVLTKFEDYPKWNPFIKQIKGNLQVGEQISIETDGFSFQPTVSTVTENREIRWLGRLWNIPGIFTGEHHLIIQPISNNQIKFVQYENFSGILVAIADIFQLSIFPDTQQNFNDMNQALKKLSEQK